jgi:cupin 2 domain-containing protein
MKNLLSDIPATLPEELCETLVQAKSVRIERIVSHGQASPEGFWYDQPQHEWVVLWQGAARLRFEHDDDVLELQPGDFVNIPAHLRHRVEWTTPVEPTVWLAIHYG